MIVNDVYYKIIKLSSFAPAPGSHEFRYALVGDDIVIAQSWTMANLRKRCAELNEAFLTGYQIGLRDGRTGQKQFS